MDKQLIDEIIHVLDIKLSEPDFKLLISILQACEPAVRKRVFTKEFDTQFEKNKAPNVLPAHLRNKYLKGLMMHPPGMVNRVFDKFTEPLSIPTLAGDPQQSNLKSLHYNAEKAAHAKLLENAGVKKPDNTGSVVKLNQIEHTLASVDYMSQKDRQIVFNAAQKVFLSNIIDTLVKEKQDIGNNADELRALELKIYGGTQTEDEMYKLTHEYILHMYHAELTPITTSANLLKFIEKILPVLSACMSPYYEREKDIIDFKNYLPLLKKYIELVLKEYGIVLEGDSTQIAELIMGIIKEHICAFVQVAGDPAICIRPTVLEVTKKFIIEGVHKFLSDYTPPTPYTQPSKKPRTEEGGNHSRIKKYKNRTKHRTMRRTKYRTKCKTKYRTSRRYKIKNKKTRKIYKY